MQVIDPKTGLLTRDGADLIRFMVEAVNGAGAVLTNDGIQTLTNKTIDGDSNTLRDIPTSALKSTTGDENEVVTGAAGISGTLAQWDSNGDLIEGPQIADITDTALPVDGSAEMQAPLPLRSYLVAEVPDATDGAGTLIFVSNEAGGAVLAYSNGTNWLRVQDLAIIS